MALRLSKKEQLALKKFRAALEKALGRNLVEVKIFGSKVRGDVYDFRLYTFPFNSKSKKQPAGLGPAFGGSIFQFRPFLNSLFKM